MTPDFRPIQFWWAAQPVLAQGCPECSSELSIVSTEWAAHTIYDAQAGYYEQWEHEPEDLALVHCQNEHRFFLESGQLSWAPR